MPRFLQKNDEILLIKVASPHSARITIKISDTDFDKKII
jgi:hypothetical protein